MYHGPDQGAAESNPTILEPTDVIARLTPPPFAVLTCILKGDCGGPRTHPGPRAVGTITEVGSAVTA